MMKLSERRARERGLSAAGELRLVEAAERLVLTDDLFAITALGQQIEETLAPHRAAIGPALDAYHTLDDVTRRRLELAATEAAPIIEHLRRAETILTARAEVLAAKRGLVF